MTTAAFLLQGLVSTSTLDAIGADPDAYLDVPLTHIGVDSLAVFEIISRIEERLGHELDYDVLTYDNFATLRGLQDLLASE